VAADSPGLWNFQQARIYGAQGPGNDGSGITVAVVDTWVDPSHPQFGGRVLQGADCTLGTCTPITTESSDSCWHGTHVAGTIAAAEYGVAPKARILPVRVLQFDPTATSEDGERGACVGTPAAVGAGIRYAIAQHAQVINLSLGALVADPNDAVIQNAVVDAATAGAVVVFAAGNGAYPVNASYGSSSLVVAATGPGGSVASYSQTAGATIAAPGGDTGSGSAACAADGSDCISSTYLRHQLAVSEGTSMAAPHVSGTAALILAESRGATRQDVTRRLLGTARPLRGQAFGLLDATAAVTAGNSATLPARGAASPQPQSQSSPRPAPGTAPDAARVAAEPAVLAAPLGAPTVSLLKPALIAAALLALQLPALLRALDQRARPPR
jgi:subtilisin family serine protease